MGYIEARAELDQLEERLNAFTQFSERIASAQKEIGTAELALEGNKNNPEALKSLRDQVHNIRVRILSEFAGIAKLYDVPLPA